MAKKQTNKPLFNFNTLSPSFPLSVTHREKMELFVHKR